MKIWSQSRPSIPTLKAPLKQMVFFLIFLYLLFSSPHKAFAAAETKAKLFPVNNLANHKIDDRGRFPLISTEQTQPTQTIKTESSHFSLAPDLVGKLANTTGVAWGDFDNDGDLDLAVANGSIFSDIPMHEKSQLYVNNNGVLTLGWESTETDSSRDIAWVDYDNDHDLDLSVGGQGANRLYRNDNGKLTINSIWPLNLSDDIHSIAWGDVDDDGDLDLVVGNGTISVTSGSLVFMPQHNRLYRNGGSINGEPPKFMDETLGEVDQVGVTMSMAWGDYDGDHDLDLAVGNIGVAGSPSRIYRNDGGKLVLALNFGAEFNALSVAWGDYDGDHDLDLAVGNGGPPVGQPNHLYQNKGVTADGITPDFQLVWASDEQDTTTSVAWGDYDGDGDLDLAVGNAYPFGLSAIGQPNRLYQNNQGKLELIWTSAEVEDTLDLAWGDYDNDGDLDLVAGNSSFPIGGLARLYRNDDATLLKNAYQLPTPADSTETVAWGDYDHDGDLDFAVANDFQPNRLYRNDGSPNNGPPNFSAMPTSIGLGISTDLAWGDYDNDGDLDLAVANWGRADCIYGNDGITADHIPIFNQAWCTPQNENSSNVSWGDYDGDGDLDLAVANSGQPNRVYRNDGFIFTLAWSTPTSEDSSEIVWGDYDNDGDLDLAVANGDSGASVYRNDSGTFTPVWQSSENDITNSLAWGDYDNDGDLDLITGNHGPNRLYRNDHGQLTSRSVWSSAEADITLSLAWGDYDNDGDLDLAVGNGAFNPATTIGQPNRLYRNDHGMLMPGAIWSSADSLATTSVAWGDYDNDGDLDLLGGNSEASILLYANSRDARGGLPLIRISRPFSTTNADFQSTPAIWIQPTLPITYTLIQSNSVPVQAIKATYSLNGGGNWLPAIATTDTITTNLSTSPAGTTHLYNWDVVNSGVLGQSGNVVFRLVAIPAIVNLRNGIPGPYLYGLSASSTFPFSVRGNQVYVEDITEKGVADALVYRLPTVQTVDGFPISNGVTPFYTNGQGYLQGRSELKIGDRLLALQPVPLPLTSTMAWAVGLTNTIHLYHTNGEPTQLGVDTPIKSSNTLTVTKPGVQVLQVSPAHSLLLFDLNVALEWDASADPNRRYLNQLESDLKKASAYLYDFSNGQVALGHITVTQNAENWAYADVVVQATNRLRPLAVQGGIVTTSTKDIDHSDIVYDPGQVRMGATWNRYGEPGQNLGTDWPLALAHELSHYLFFLDDAYLGLDDKGLLVAEDRCKGSVMGDMYDPSGVNTEYVPDADWSPNCATTLANRTLGRSEWATIQQRYPAIFASAHYSDNVGPLLMPFSLTEVKVITPLLTTNALPDPIYFLDYQNNEVSSPSARAYLIRDDKFVYDLGSPVGGQNRLLTRGPRPGDRLCVFDSIRTQFGCKAVKSTDEHLSLKRDENWKPKIELRPLTTTTLSIIVSGLPPLDKALQARLYPEYYTATQPITLNLINGVYSGTFQLLDFPALVGYVQLWVAEPFSDENPRREVMVAYTMGGNLGHSPLLGFPKPPLGGKGPAFRYGGPAFRYGGPELRSGNAPLASSDGQMIFFNEDLKIFNEGELYIVQNASALPEPPNGKQVVGLAYSLLASPNITHIITGAVSFQYLGIDTLVQGIPEEAEKGLTIHVWQQGTGWRALETTGSAKYNLASAASQGPGIYALMAGSTQPQVTEVAPRVVFTDVTASLTLTGENFLGPMLVELQGADKAVHTLSAHVLTTKTLTVELPAQQLTPQEYNLTVINGDGASVAAPGSLTVLAKQNASCFYDDFASGPNQWQREGAWGIVPLPDGAGYAMTDSPTGNYDSAPPSVQGNNKISTSLISPPIDLATCPHKTLSFDQAYVLANGDQHKDQGFVEISSDGGIVWTVVMTYTGDSAAGEATAATLPGEEWKNSPLKAASPLDLSAYAGIIQLRFRLEVDEHVADKGWVLDNIEIGGAPIGLGTQLAPTTHQLFLPLVMN